MSLLTTSRSSLSDWARHLRGRNRAPRTIDSYLEVGRAFREYLLRVGHSMLIGDIDRRAVEDYLLDLSERTHQRSTDKSDLSCNRGARHYRSLQQLFRWLELEEEIQQLPFTKMSPPTVPEQPVPLLTDEEIGRLLDVCRGNDFDSRRDTAIFRLLLDSGLRVAELIGIRLAHLNFDQDVAIVLGKGRRQRAAPFGNRTGQALRRYLRARAKHPLAQATDALWLGRLGPMTGSGVRQMMERRGTRPESRESTRTGSATSSRISGWLRAAPSRTSCAWQAGAPGKCSADTQPVQQMNVHAKLTNV